MSDVVREAFVIRTESRSNRWGLNLEWKTGMNGAVKSKRKSDVNDFSVMQFFLDVQLWLDVFIYCWIFFSG